MKMKFLLHEKDLWEIASRELLPPKVEFEGCMFEHCLFMKKEKLD
jgi:hypothetical protein